LARVEALLGLPRRLRQPPLDHRGAARRFGPAVALVLLAGAVALTVGCSAPFQPGPMLDTDPDFTGFVTAIEPGSDEAVLATIFVESHADKLVHRLVTIVTSDTLFFVRDAAGTRAASFDALRVQDQVQIWMDRAAQPAAQQVLIVQRY
jgi:hypothetical protein